jgi:hypothetical protein
MAWRQCQDAHITAPHLSSGFHGFNLSHPLPSRGGPHPPGAGQTLAWRCTWRKVMEGLKALVVGFGLVGAARFGSPGRFPLSPPHHHRIIQEH